MAKIAHDIVQFQVQRATSGQQLNFETIHESLLLSLGGDRGEPEEWTDAQRPVPDFGQFDSIARGDFLILNYRAVGNWAPSSGYWSQMDYDFSMCAWDDISKYGKELAAMALDAIQAFPQPRRHSLHDPLTMPEATFLTLWEWRYDDHDAEVRLLGKVDPAKLAEALIPGNR